MLFRKDFGASNLESHTGKLGVINISNTSVLWRAKKNSVKSVLCALLLLACSQVVLADASSDELASIVALINDIRKNPSANDFSVPGRPSFLNLNSNSSVSASNLGSGELLAPAEIIGGNNADRNEYREYTLVIGTDGQGDITFLCGGTLISSNTVLTAAHCSDAPASTYFAIPGFYSFDDDVEAANLFQVGRVAVHPQYDAAAINNDIAVMTLSQPSSISPASVHQGSSDLAGSSGIVIGTGLTASSPTPVAPTILQEVAAPITNNAECATQWINLAGINPVTESVLCAGFTTNARGTCSGDSGGPLFADIDGVRTVVGTVSFGIVPCEANRATQGFARTSALIDFIASASPNTQFIATSGDAGFLPPIMMLLDEAS